MFRPQIEEDEDDNDILNHSLSHEQQLSNILRISKLLEVVIRNLHNADELLHQSFR
jgi:hypothetical protein